MTNIIKKYWLTIIVILILNILFWYFIPKLEKFYIEPDIDAIKKKSHLVLMWTEIIFFAILFIFSLRNLKKLKQFFSLLFNISVLALTFFFFFDSIFYFATLFLNKLSKSETVDKKYSVVYIDNDKKYLLLWDNNSKTSIRADNLLITNDKLKINERDTVVVSFTKGLLGFNFDPKITVIKNTVYNRVRLGSFTHSSTQNCI